MSVPRPPRWARAFAAMVVRGPTREIVLGDLEEMHVRAGRSGPTATLRYLGWSVGSGLYELRSALGDGLRMDLVVALRQFRRRPSVYVGGALVLAVGLGIATLTWGVRYGAVGRPLPVTDSDRMISLRIFDEENRRRMDLSIEDAHELLNGASSIEVIALWTSGLSTLVDRAGPAEEIDTYRVTAGLFDILEIVPLHGRRLLPSDDAPGAPPVAVLGYQHWRERFGEDVGVLGRTVSIDGEPTVIVGVLAPGGGLTAHEDYWTSVGATVDRSAREYKVFVRMARGASLASVTSELESLSARLAADGRPEWLGTVAVPTTIRDALYGSVESTRNRVLWTGGVLLFVMALANVANLFLVTARHRAHELAIRRALGAGRLRVLRQLVLEAAIPAFLGFAGAAVVAGLSLAWYQVAADDYGVGYVWERYRLEGPHLVLLAMGALSSTVFVSLAAAYRELSGDGGLVLRRGRGELASSFRLGRVFLGVEVAVGAALLLVASLMVRSAWNQNSFEYGFSVERVMTADVTLRGERYADPETRLEFWARLSDELRRLDGVSQSTIGTQLPLIRCCGNRFRIEVEGWDVAEPSELPTHYVSGVEPTYFDTFQASLVAGRGITSADAADSDPVALVNVHFADRYFDQASPVGRRVRLWRGSEPGIWRTVIGVAPHLWMDTDVNADPEGLYVPLAQIAPMRASFAIQTVGPAEGYGDTLREAVARIDSDLPVTWVRTMPQLFRDRTSLYRREGPLFTLLGFAALLLAIAGLYAVVSYMSSLRTAEFGLRSALGASRAELMLRSVRGSTLPTAVGSLVGLVIGLALTRGFDRFVFMVDPWSPWVASATVLLLVGSAAMASMIPAWRASRADPVTALRTE